MILDARMMKSVLKWERDNNLYILLRSLFICSANHLILLPSYSNLFFMIFPK